MTPSFNRTTVQPYNRTTVQPFYPPKFLPRDLEISEFSIIAFALAFDNIL